MRSSYLLVRIYTRARENIHYGATMVLTVPKDSESVNNTADPRGVALDLGHCSMMCPWQTAFCFEAGRSIEGKIDFFHLQKRLI